MIEKLKVWSAMEKPPLNYPFATIEKVLKDVIKIRPLEQMTALFSKVIYLLTVHCTEMRPTSISLSNAST